MQGYEISVGYIARLDWYMESKTVSKVTGNNLLELVFTLLQNGALLYS